MGSNKDFGYDTSFLNFKCIDQHISTELKKISEHLILSGLSFVITKADGSILENNSPNYIFAPEYYIGYEWNSTKHRILERPNREISNIGRFIDGGCIFTGLPEKGYTAKASLKVKYAGGSGDLVVLVFRPGDATGDNTGENSINHREGMDKYWTPRNKKDFSEAFFSIGTGYNDLWMPRMTSLDAVTIAPSDAAPRIYKRLLGNETVSKDRFLESLVRPNQKPSLGMNERIDFTFLNKGDESFGNPHCIGYDKELTPMEAHLTTKPTKNLFQAGAFLSFPEENEGYTKLRKIAGK